MHASTSAARPTRSGILARPAAGGRARRARAVVAAQPPRASAADASTSSLPTTPPPSGCPLGFGGGGEEEGVAQASPTLSATAIEIPAPLQSGPDAHAASLPLAPGTKGLPFIGETFEMFKDIPGFHARRLARYGRVYRSHALGAPLTCIADAAQVRRLLLGEGGPTPITATDWTPAVRALLGPESLLMKSGPSHAASRRILAQAFTAAAVDSYQPLVKSATDAAVASWADACAAAPGATVSALSKGKDLAFAVAARALIAGDMPEETMDSFRHDFDLFTLGFFGIPVPLPGTAFRRALVARERVLARIDTLIDAEDAAIKAEEEAAAAGITPTRTAPKTALRLMMTADDPEHPGSKIRRDELRDQVVTQLFAGHETTGTTLARLMAFVNRDRFPEVLDRLVAEQEALIAQFGPELTPEVLTKMPYLDSVVKETHRLFPIVSGVFRKALVDLDVCGYRVPAGERVMVMLGQTQNQVEEFQGDLAEFRPERWLAFTKREPDAFMMWGAGPHVCLGQKLAARETLVILATLVRGYEWAPADPDVGTKWKAPLQPADGVPVQVWRRGEPRPPPPVVQAADKAVEDKADAWWVGA